MDFPAQRRAVVLDAHGAPDVMRVETQPVPPLPDGHVLVAVQAIGVNFGDTLLRQGRYRLNAPLTLSPGFEIAGRVLGAASGVDIAEGTPVAAFVDDGGYASVVAVPADRVFRTPDGMPATQAAALLIQGLTAWFAVHRFGGAQPGEHVLVHAAAGGVGSLAVQLARRAGALPIATASSEEKRQLALDRGAVTALPPEPDGLTTLLREATHGHGVDVVVDGVGGPLFEPSLRALAAGGRYVVLGAASGEAANLDVRRLMFRTQHIIGFVLARLDGLYPGEPARAWAELGSLVARGELQLPVIELPLDQVVQAHEMLASRTVVGKIVLTV